MNGQTTYTLGPDVPDGEVLRDGAGRVVDDDYVVTAVADARRHVRGRGRPSLSETGESPLLRVRVPRELLEAVELAARESGTSRADWVRRALAQALRPAG